MARNASMRRRTGWYTHGLTTLDAHSKPRGIAAKIASKVPQMAIWTVTSISLT